jgi:hypothetical protein
VSIDYGERERQFLETLKGDTGRALDEWMAAITAEGLTHRNDIIDWLRRQGFMFSKASWLERIHNNGGRPIYADAAGARARARPEPRPRLAVAPAAAAPPPLKPVPPPAPTPPVLKSSPPATPPGAAPAAREGDQAAVDALLARAKAYRPLAAHLLAEVLKSVPDAAVLPHDGYVVFRRGGVDFALLALSTRELRLALTLRTPPPDAALVPAKLPGLRGTPAVTHMAVLTDARQVTPALLAAVARAAAGA